MTELEVLRAESLAGERLDAARPYCEEHVSDLGGMWVEWRGRHVVAVAAFADHVEQHRAAIGPAIDVVAVPRPHGELVRLQGPAWEFAAAFPEARVISVGLDIRRGCIALAIEPDGDAIALDAALLERFGSAVESAAAEVTDYTDARANQRRRPRSADKLVEGWSTDEGGLELTIHYIGGAGDVRRPTITLDESPRRIGILLLVPRKAPEWGLRYNKAGRARTATAELSEPIAGRPVVNLATGRALPRHRAPRVS